MTHHASGDDFVIGHAGEFDKSAVYFPSMDYVDYVREDAVRISERVDQFLSVVWNENGEMIGFKLKGIKNYFLKHLKPALSLEDDDFVWVLDLLVALATEKGDKMFPDDDKKVVRLAAYRKAVKIAREDKVYFRLPENEQMAA